VLGEPFWCLSTVHALSAQPCATPTYDGVADLWCGSLRDICGNFWRTFFRTLSTDGTIIIGRRRRSRARLTRHCLPQFRPGSRHATPSRGSSDPARPANQTRPAFTLPLWRSVTVTDPGTNTVHSFETQCYSSKQRPSTSRLKGMRVRVRVSHSTNSRNEK
jgi:hypothetical protein